MWPLVTRWLDPDPRSLRFCHAALLRAENHNISAPPASMNLPMPDPRYVSIFINRYLSVTWKMGQNFSMC